MIAVIYLTLLLGACALLIVALQYIWPLVVFVFWATVACWALVAAVALVGGLISLLETRRK